MPVVDKYASEGKAHKISAVPPPEEVFSEVEKILEPVFGENRSSIAGSAPASIVAPAVASTVTPDFAALATASQPVVLYSKRPSANWVNPLFPPPLFSMRLPPPPRHLCLSHCHSLLCRTQDKHACIWPHVLMLQLDISICS